MDGQLYNSNLVNDGSGSVYLQYNAPLSSFSNLSLSLKSYNSGSQIEIDSIFLNASPINIGASFNSSNGANISGGSIILDTGESASLDLGSYVTLPPVVFSMPLNDTVIGGGSGGTQNGGGGNDTIDYSSSTNNVFVSLRANRADTDGDGTFDAIIQNFENATLTNFNDVVFGTDGNNILEGLDGNDYLRGYDGDDMLVGGDGDDEFFGDGGDDSIYVGRGDDKVFAGAGNDIIYVQEGNNTIDGQDGINTIDFSLSTHQLFINLNTGFADYDNDGTPDNILRNIQNINLTNQNDVAYANDAVNIINAGNGNDIVYGYGGDDVINGQMGNDLIHGGVGNDTINGNEGIDYLFGDAGDDIINGGSGNDELLGNEGADTINGDEGNDRIYGDDGEDIILGGAGNDHINGGNDNDTISGGDGHDLLFGDDGDDTLNGDAGLDRLYGGEGNDTLNGGDDVDHLYGENGNDTINGGNGGDFVYGGAGNDTINGGAGFDRLHGGDGDDIIRGGDDADMIWGEGGDDILYADEGASVLSGGDGNDILHGSDVLDQLYGNDGNDILNGNGGDDLLKGHEGNDVLNAGDGNDTLIWDGGDVFNGGAGFDRLTLAELDTSTIAIYNGTLNRYSGIDMFVLNNFNDEAAANHLNISMGNIDEISDNRTLYITGDEGLDMVTIRNINITNDYQGVKIIDGITYEHYVRGGNTLYIQVGLNIDGPGGNGGTIITGTENDDIPLSGTSADEIILGLGGNDIIIGGGGADELSGGNGDDILIFDDMDDIYNGGGGLNDTLQLGAGNATNFDFFDITHDNGIERIALNNYGGVAVTNTLAVNHNLIDNFTSTRTLHITGDVGVDSVVISSYSKIGNYEGLVYQDGILYEHFFKSNTNNNLYVQLGLNSTGSVSGATGLENIVVGTAGNDTNLTGTTGADILLGLGGDDVFIYESAQSDLYFGGEGIDTLQLGSGDTSNFDLNDITHDRSIEIIALNNIGGAVANTFDLNMNNIDEFSAARTLTITGDVGTDIVDIASYNKTVHHVGNDLIDGALFEIYFKSNNTLYVQRGLNEDGTGDGGAVSISHVAGTSGDDTALYGTSGDELILGLLGNDTLYSNGGTDILDGGDGDDILVLEDLNDTFIGGFGTDKVQLGAGITIDFDMEDIIANRTIEQIALDNLGAAEANHLTINHSRIDNWGANRTLYVSGDVGQDTVSVSNLDTVGSFVETVTVGGVNYDYYFQNNNHLYVEQGLIV